MAMIINKKDNKKEIEELSKRIEILDKLISYIKNHSNQEGADTVIDKNAIDKELKNDDIIELKVIDSKNTSAPLSSSPSSSSGGTSETPAVKTENSDGSLKQQKVSSTGEQTDLAAQQKSSQSASSQPGAGKEDVNTIPPPPPSNTKEAESETEDAVKNFLKERMKKLSNK